MADNSRADALRRLAELGAPTAASSPEAPKVKATGDEVEAGGDVRRLLVRPAHLTYRDKGGTLLHAFPQVGDVILVTAAQAKRLDSLGVTVEEDATDEEVEAAVEGEVTDEQLRAMSAADAVAHVNQHPEHKARVRELELERDTPRVTVLKATEDEDGEDPEDDDDEA